MKRLQTFDGYVQDAMRSWSCPGVALSIVRGDELLHQNVHGLRDVENNLAMTTATRFPLASVTKSFTAMSVALLVDEGKLEWDMPVREYMPEFVLRDAYVTQHLTVRDMLSHRTGLPRHDLAAWGVNISRAEFIKRMRHLEFSASFRQRYQYNNLMYHAVAYLVEKVAGQKWEDFVAERIFSPLGMTASSFKPEPPQEGHVNTTGYRVGRDEKGKAQGVIRVAFGPYSELDPGAAGALFSTLADLTQWLKVHVNGGHVGEVRLVSEDNLKQMHLPQTVIPGGGLNESLLGNTVFTYGMGWFVEPYRGHTLIHHGGNVPGHSLTIGFIPQEKIGVAALTNIAALPLCSVLLYESIDRVLELANCDWNNRFHTAFDPFISASAHAKQTSVEERIIDAPPTHALEDYVGTYTADGYPDFAVCLDGNDLQARTADSLGWSELRHYHHNVFEWRLADLDISLKLRFAVNGRGEIDAISIPVESQLDDLTFTRRGPELAEDIIAALVGRYDSPVDGFSFTVSTNGDKVYVAQTGKPPEEISLHKLTEDLVEFKLKRSRLGFMREGGAIDRMVLKGPFITLQALRRTNTEGPETDSLFAQIENR